MPKLKTILRLAAIFSLALTLNLGAALAQDDSVAAEEIFAGDIKAPAAESTAAEEDNALSAEILGVEAPSLLPTSPFYFFKEIGRGLGNVFAFSAENKAERRMEQAAERLAEAKAMIAEASSDNNRANKKITNSLIKYQKDIAKAEASLGKIKEDSDAYNNLMDKAVDKYSAFAKVMAVDEDLALDIDKDIVQEIYKSKEIVLDNLAGIIDKLPDPEKLTEVLQNQAGSDFKEFRNLEVLGELQGKLPEQAAEAVKQAQEKIRARMEEKLAAAADGKTGEDFANYVIALKGNQVEHMAILDELGKSENLPDEVAAGFRKAKDAVAINFSKKMINHPSSRQLVEDIASGDIDKLRVLEQMSDALPDYSEVKEELNQARERALNRAVEKISEIESVDDKINFLIKDGVPDAKSFVILDQLQAKFTPEQQETMKAVRNKAFEIFSDIVDNAENSEKLLERLSSDSPKDIEVIAAIRKNLPAGVALKFETLVKKQLERVEERLANEENLEKLIDLRAQIDDSPEAQSLIASVRPGLIEKINKEQVDKVAQAFEKAADPSRVVEIANKYNEILEKYPSVAETLKKVNPGLVKNLIDAQTKKIEEGIEKISDPEEMQAVLEKLEAVGMEKFKDQIGPEAKAKITNRIVGQQKEIEKNKFMEQISREAGGEINRQEMEKVFNENVGSLIESSGGQPTSEIRERAEKIIREQVGVMIQKKQAEQQILESLPADIPNREEVENRMRRELAPKEINAPLELKEIDPARQEASGQMQAPPSAEEIERIKQEQIRQQAPQTMGPTPEQIQQMQQAPAQAEN
ncbi:MAG: DUF5667 domain-containing protein [Patescibacteria group bacterium]|nr:DUF5667 domain-containing protein [Patescibacteria group bacterium]